MGELESRTIRGMAGDLTKLRTQLASEKAETERFRALAENQTEAVKTYMAQLATANAETARLGRELEEARAKCTALVKECDNYELRLGQMARAQTKPQHDAMLAAMDKATDTIEGILTGESDTAKQLAAANARIDRLRVAIRIHDTNWCDAITTNGLTPEQINAVTGFVLGHRPVEIDHALSDTHHDLNTGGASDALRAQSDAPTKEAHGAD